MKNNSVFLLVTLLFPFFSIGQSYSPEKKFAPSDLTKDLSYLEVTTLKNHPPFIFNTNDSVADKVRQQKKLLNAMSFANKVNTMKNKIMAGDSLTEVEFLRIISALNFSIQCAHSDIRPSDSLSQWWKENAILTPFNIRFVRHGFFIHENYSENDSLTVGSRIVSINYESIYKIYRDLRLRIPSDGKNSTRIQNALQKGFYRYYSYYIQLTSPTYTIKYVPFGDTVERTTTVKGISKEILDEKRKALKKPSPAPISFTTIDSLDAALLTIPTFRNGLFEKAGINFSDYLESTFSNLDTGTKNLIIDLRGNGGGYSEYGAQLLSYLTDKPFLYCRNLWLASPKLKKEIKYDIPETFKGFPKGIVKEDGGYKWKKHSVLGRRQPAKNNFKGKVYFLIDGGCSSTTSEVASIAKENNMGVFVGEEVGGKFAGDNGGVLGWFELPNTKIKVRLGLVEYELAVTGDNDDYGVRPDYGALPGIEDFVNGRDKDFELIILLIKKKL